MGSTAYPGAGSNWTAPEQCILSARHPVVLTTPVAYAQTANIEVQGNRRVEAATIRSYFKPGPGGRLGAFEIDEAYKALYNTGLFQDVNIRQAGGRMVVTVVENPVINRIQFEGNKRIKDDQLKPEIQSKERGTLSRGWCSRTCSASSKSIAAAAATM